MPYSIDTVHPLLVHFPIALFSTGLFFDILAKLLDNEEFDHAGFWTMLMALISSPFTIIAGIFAFMEEGSWLDLYQFQHGILVLISTLFLLVLFWARIKIKPIGTKWISVQEFHVEIDINLAKILLP
jgi:uncharacterized membrane protein